MATAAIAKEVAAEVVEVADAQARPIGQLERTAAPIVREALKEMVTITENGRRRPINKLEIIIKQVVNDAAKGDARARKDVFAMWSELIRLDGEQAARTQAGSPRTHVVVLPHNGRDPLDPELEEVCKKAAIEHHAKKRREAEALNPANENREREVA
jgi:Family of unknown function (DUF5681)